jgi:hypothetical protein
MPVNAAGIRRDPTKSEPRPMTDPAEANKAACTEENIIEYKICDLISFTAFV